MYHTASDVLGVLIARSSGQALETFVRERILEPLGMNDTGFSVPAAKLDRLATCYEIDPETGALEVFDGVDDSQWSRPPEFPSAGGGLVSTVDDVLAFGQMMLNKGKHGNERILSRPSVETMTTDQLTPGQKALSEFSPGYWDSHGWGFRPVDRHQARRPGRGSRTVWLVRWLGYRLGFGPPGEHGHHPDDPALGLPTVLRGLSRFLDLGLPGDRRLT